MEVVSRCAGIGGKEITKSMSNRSQAGERRDARMKDCCPSRRVTIVSKILNFTYQLRKPYESK
jgi:hypothetical protein